MTTQHEQWLNQRDTHVLQLVNALAQDIGRMRRHQACHGTSLEHVADRLANAVEHLYWAHIPTAGQLVSAGCPVDTALDIVDAWQAQLERTLGENSIRELRGVQPTELAA